MYRIHCVRKIALGQIVQFTNHRLVHELSLVLWGIIKVMMKQSLGTHGNGICSGPGTKTDVFYYILCKSELREIIRSVPFLLNVYPYLVDRVSLALYLEILSHRFLDCTVN